VFYLFLDILYIWYLQFSGIEYVDYIWNISNMYQGFFPLSLHTNNTQNGIKAVCCHLQLKLQVQTISDYCVLSFDGFCASEFYVLTFQNTLPGNHPKERIQLSQHGESLISRISDYTITCEAQTTCTSDIKHGNMAKSKEQTFYSYVCKSHTGNK
jgi:hypothetical protein